MRLHKGRPREASWIWIVANRNISSADTYLVKSFLILFFTPITVGRSVLSPPEVKPPICTLSTIPLTFSRTKLWKFYSLQGISPLISTCAHILFNIQTCFRIATQKKKKFYTLLSSFYHQLPLPYHLSCLQFLKGAGYCCSSYVLT